MKTTYRWGTPTRRLAVFMASSLAAAPAWAQVEESPAATETPVAVEVNQAPSTAVPADQADPKAVPAPDPELDQGDSTAVADDEQPSAESSPGMESASDVSSGSADGTAPPPVTTEGDSADDLEAEAYLGELTEARTQSELSALDAGPRLNIYGFADFSYIHELGNFAFAIPAETFMIGNLNLYVGSELGAGWRTLAEFRLLYLPNGTYANNDFTSPRTDTSVADPADLNRPLRWGGIEIERAWLEYQAHTLLTIRGGQWLTPYGIWNVDHGSPTIIGVRRPYVIGEQLFPERQTGLLVYGSGYIGSNRLEYDVGLSNGRGPIDSYQDLDHNKAVTARASLENESFLGNVKVGVTVYRGAYTDTIRQIGIGTDGYLKVTDELQTQFNEFSAGVDLKWSLGDFTLQGEGIMREVAYTDDAPRPVNSTGAPSSSYVPDRRIFGAYAMAWYRLPWLATTPYIGGDAYDTGSAAGGGGSLAVFGGLNVRPTPQVALKAELTKYWLTRIGDDPGLQGGLLLGLQAAWSF